MARPVHLDPVLVLIVAAGGTLGTAARYLLTTAVHPQAGWPVATLVENVVGAFVLGALLETLVRRGDETPGVRRVRLGAGTGFLGGFTTFSSLAIETERLLVDGAVGTAVGYVSVSLVLGFLACLAGVVLAAARHRRSVAP
ncbi:CrcB family protein [Sanguibacter sp. 25GB23B1]|uniref:fluoride efflux transporter FluC n=1 Tax=unclassified Sanguibacter TaxID=2645534 RepID=UPI0032AEAAA0